jgi:hypothetical protein
MTLQPGSWRWGFLAGSSSKDTQCVRLLGSAVALWKSPIERNAPPNCGAALLATCKIFTIVFSDVVAEPQE